MTGFPRLLAFISDESGVVTVDWVVLTAALVASALTVTNIVSNAMEDLAAEIHAELLTDRIQTSFSDPDQYLIVDASDVWDYEFDIDG